jgi:hypothetical protein
VTDEAVPSEVGAAPAEADGRQRLVVGLFVAYTLVLVVAAWAQWTDNRAVLDLLDLRRFFK